MGNFKASIRFAVAATLIFAFVDNFSVSADDKLSKIEARLHSVIKCDFGIRCEFNEVFVVKYSPDGKLLAAAGSGNNVVILDAKTRKKLHELKGHGMFVTSLAFSADSRLLSSASFDGTLIIWDCVSGKKLSTIGNHCPYTYGIAFLKDGKSIVSGSVSKTEERGTFSLWNTKTGEERLIEKTYDEVVGYTSASNDGKLIATAGPELKINLWESGSLKKVAKLLEHTDDILKIQFTPDDRALVSVSADRTAKVWNLESRKCMLTYRGHDGKLIALSIHPNGKTVATVGVVSEKNNEFFCEIHIWNILNGELLGKIGADIGSIYDVAFSPDGGFLAAACGDGSVRIWELKNK